MSPSQQNRVPLESKLQALLNKRLAGTRELFRLTRKKLDTGYSRVNAGWLSKILAHKKSHPLMLEPGVLPPPSPAAQEMSQELTMMECTPFQGKASCSDTTCRCSYTTMPPAKGYLWIKPEVAETRMSCLSLTALHGYLTASALSGIEEIRRRCLPMVVCEQSAKQHNLNLAVASSDYHSWVKSGKVPCRSTPLVSHSPLPALKIGDNYGGGTVFYIDPTGQYALIAAKTDVPHPASILDEDCFSWYDAETVCHNLANSGYRDWLLPDKEQLHQLYLQRDLLGGFADDIYWSSTEYDTDYAWTRGFGDGSQNGYGKDFSGRVRAVRTVNS